MRQPVYRREFLRACAGAGAFAACRTWSEGAEAAQGGAYAAGYRETEVVYKDDSGAEVRRKLFLWYPTTEKAREYTYGDRRGQVGMAAPEAAVAAGQFPLIVFSHGFGGSGQQTIFLTEELARAGYLVAAPNHADTGLFMLASAKASPPEFEKPRTWTDKKYLDRHADVRAVLAEALGGGSGKSPFAGHVDAKAIGMAGHSLGGYTSLASAGAWESWLLPEVRAVLAMSPYAQPFLEGDRLARVKVPVMLQGGTADIPITAFLPAVYAKLTGAKYFLVLKGENHFAWTNFSTMRQVTTDAVRSGNVGLIAKYSVAFFDRHLRNRAEAAAVLEKGEGLEKYERSGG